MSTTDVSVVGATTPLSLANSFLISASLDNFFVLVLRLAWIMHLTNEILCFSFCKTSIILESSSFFLAQASIVENLRSPLFVISVSTFRAEKAAWTILRSSGDNVCLKPRTNTDAELSLDA